jgi:hypothetical protein
MNTRILPLLALALLALSGCAPSAERPSLRPVVVKVSTSGVTGPAAAAPGQEVTIQGRDLGGPANSAVIFRADDLGRGGTRTAQGDVVSWTSAQVVVKVPAGTRPGGGFLFVEVGGVLSNAMPFSVNQ